MASNLTLQPILIETGSDDTDGRLVLRDGHLVAVLVRLDGPEHGDLQGFWHLEAGFGPCDQKADAFHSLNEAQRWIGCQLTLETPLAAP